MPRSPILSSLVNSVVHSEVDAEDQLLQTLDYSQVIPPPPLPISVNSLNHHPHHPHHHHNHPHNHHHDNSTAPPSAATASSPSPSFSSFHKVQLHHPNHTKSLSWSRNASPSPLRSTLDLPRPSASNSHQTDDESQNRGAEEEEHRRDEQHAYAAPDQGAPALPAALPLPLPHHRRQPYLQDDATSLFALNILRLFITGISGFIIGVVGISIINSIKYFALMNIYILNTSLASDKVNAAFTLTVLFTSSFAFVASLCVIFGSSHVKGSATEQLNAYLQGLPFSSRLLSLQTLVFKSVGLIASVCAQFHLGVESPFLHIAAMIGLHTCRLIVYISSRLCDMSQATSMSLLIQTLSSPLEERLFISATTSAGFATAFNAPLAGVLIIQDSSFSFWSRRLTLHAFLCTMIAVTTLNFLTISEGVLPSRGFLDWSDSLPTSIRAIEFPAFVLIALIGAFLASSFTAINRYCKDLRSKHLKNKRLLILLDAMLCSLATVVLSFSLPFLFPCIRRDDVPRCSLHPEQCLRFNCSPGSYSSLATLLFSLPEDVIKILWAPSSIELTTDFSSTILLLVFVCSYFFMSALVYNVVAGGIFVPLILIGSAVGRLVGMFTSVILSGSSASSTISIGSYAVLGSAALLAGQTHYTLPLCVMLIEITSDAQFIVPIMLVVLLSSFCSQRFSDYFFQVTNTRKSINLLLEEMPTHLNIIQARDLLNEDNEQQQVIYLHSSEHPNYMRQILNNTNYNQYPVVDGNSSNTHHLYIGCISRRDLITAMKSQEHIHTFSASASSSSSPSSSSSLTSPSSQSHAMVDLLPFVDQSAFIVTETTRLSKIWSMFRSLSLRFVVVVSQHHEPVRIITRGDLL